MALKILPRPITVNRIIPGIKKLVNGEFFSVSVEIPIGPFGCVIAAKPPKSAPIPTNKCRIKSTRYFFDTYFAPSVLTIIS
jgi:hypothetical protein